MNQILIVEQNCASLLVGEVGKFLLVLNTCCWSFTISPLASEDALGFGADYLCIQVTRERMPANHTERR